MVLSLGLVRHTMQRQFVPIALKQGASACLVEAVGAEVFDWDDLPNITDRVASYNGLKSACGPIAC